MKNSILVEENKYASGSITSSEKKTERLSTKLNCRVIEYLILSVLGVYYVSSLVYYFVCFMINL
jgi:hypothetical protein